MAEYPTFTADDLADFSGRPAASYPKYATTSALPQAVLLFKIATCRPTFPDDETEAQLARMAILAMADRATLSQKFQQIEASPFQSESLGSYSYSKMAGFAAKGMTTGVTWFDLAVTTLSLCDTSDDIPSGGGIIAFEYDVPQVSLPGGMRLLSASEYTEHAQYLSSSQGV